MNKEIAILVLDTEILELKTELSNLQDSLPDPKSVQNSMGRISELKNLLSSFIQTKKELVRGLPPVNPPGLPGGGPP